MGSGDRARADPRGPERRFDREHERRMRLRPDRRFELAIVEPDGSRQSQRISINSRKNVMNGAIR